MNEISEFSNETSSKIGYYVYRLVDPRNGQTFYVGKGKGNRVFQHVKGAIALYDGVDKKEIDEVNDPNKLRIIQEIRESNLKVIHVIQRWHLSEKEAIEVEAALIDAFPGLANIQRGHGSEYGVCNAYELEQRLSAKVYDEPKDFGYMIIKVRWWRINEMTDQFGVTNARYEATRGCWKIRIPDLKKYPYVFSVTDGLVKEVYKVHEWHVRGERKEFTGEVAPAEIRNVFVGKRIPDYYAKKGMASPVLKSKNI
jgi:hypothetical protein